MIHEKRREDLESAGCLWIIAQRLETIEVVDYSRSLSSNRRKDHHADIERSKCQTCKV